jgi:hypothetical protein
MKMRRIHFFFAPTDEQSTLRGDCANSDEAVVRTVDGRARASWMTGQDVACEEARNCVAGSGYEHGADASFRLSQRTKPQQDCATSIGRRCYSAGHLLPQVRLRVEVENKAEPAVTNKRQSLLIRIPRLFPFES